MVNICTIRIQPYVVRSTFRFYSRKEGERETEVTAAYQFRCMDYFERAKKKSEATEKEREICFLSLLLDDNHHFWTRTYRRKFLHRIQTNICVL